MVEKLVTLNDQVLWKSGVLQRDMPAHAVLAPVYEGGRLGFVSRNLSEAAINHANQPAWAEPHAPQAEH